MTRPRSLEGQRAHVAAGVASALLAGVWAPPQMAGRVGRALGSRRVWITRLAEAVHHGYPEPPRDRPRELRAWILACPPFDDAVRRHDLTVRRWYPAPTGMGPMPWPVVALDTVGDLHDLVGLRPTAWQAVADPRSFEAQLGPGDERLRNYRYRWVPKRSGGARLIEAPKPMLRHVQRVVLREVLDPIPAHDAAHGFRHGRSVLTHARLHVGAAVVIHLDLTDWFAAVTAGRVWGVLRQAGYPEAVAHHLTAVATTTTPAGHRGGTADAAARRRLARPHLPQGAPTSPALANLATFALDRRVASLAAAAGYRYSRYADDLALSSPAPRSRADVARTIAAVGAIAIDEGFRCNPAKTSVRRAGERQRLTGVVVNRTPNIDRRDYDRLKATLHNAARDGPAARGAEAARLLGRVAWVANVHPARGVRLRALYDAINWGAPAG